MNYWISCLSLICLGCAGPAQHFSPEPLEFPSYQEITSDFSSCSGKGKIESTGGVSGKLSFSFMSQNDSSFLQFKDPIGRKVLLMWITPQNVTAWNLIENKRYTYNEIMTFFPFLNVIEPLDVTQFLWGIEPNYEPKNGGINSKVNHQLSLKFERKELGENPSALVSVRFNDTGTNQSVKINIKERSTNMSDIDLTKIWDLIST